MAAVKKSTHKNAARSRQLIKQAFAQLLNEKDMSKITVTDIVDRAGISRGTFYAHYLDVYDLHIAVQNNMMETLNSALDEIGIDNIMRDPSIAIKTGIEFLENNKDYYKLFAVSKDGDNLVKRAMTIIFERYSDRVGELTTRNNSNLILCYLIYTLGGIKSLLMEWLNSNINLSAADCTTLLTEYVNSNRPEELKELVAKLSIAE